MKNKSNVPCIFQFNGLPVALQLTGMLAKKISPQFDPDRSDEFQCIMRLEKP
jgi:hypothetical protein